MFSILADVNQMVWFWGVLVTGLVVDLTYQVLAFLAVEKAYSTD